MLRPFLTLWIVASLAAVSMAQASPEELRAEQAQLSELLGSEASVFEKAKACQRLAIIGDASSVAAVAPLLHDPRLSAYARTVLERIPGQAADEALVAAAQQLRNPAADLGVDQDQRERLLIGIVHSLGRRADMSSESGASSASSAAAGTNAAVQRLLQELVADADLTDSVRQTAAGALTQRGGSADVKAAAMAAAELEAMIRSADARQFRQGLQLARQQGGAASDAVVRHLSALDPPRQIAVLIWLADLGDTSLRSQVEPLSRSADDEVAATAWETLAALGGLAGTDATDRADAAFDAAVNRPAIAARVMSALAGAGRDSMHQRVQQAIVALAEGERTMQTGLAVAMFDYAVRANLAAATEPLLKIADTHEDPAIVAAALRAAGSLAKISDLPQLLTVAESQRVEDASLATAADEAVQRAAVRMPPDQVARVIDELLETADGPRKARLMEHLAYVGGERALSIVAEAARGNDLAEVELATRVLGQWPSTDAADVLGDLAEELTYPTYKLRSLRGYLRIGRQFDMPADERIELATRAYALASRPEERDMALEILQRYPTLAGLRWLVQNSAAATAADDSQPAMQQTLLQVAQRVAQDQPQRVSELLQGADLESLPPPVRSELQTLAKPASDR